MSQAKTFNMRLGMRRKVISSKRFLVFLGLVVLCGCATRIRETHIFQARDPAGVGEMAYYRVTIEGDADLAKAHYRAGLYDSEALDALLIGVKTDDANGVDQILERRRREAISQIASKYYKALEETTSDEEVSERARRLAKAMLSPYLIPQQSGDEYLAQPRRKFAIIYSALASQVEEAIADFAEEKDTEELVLTALAGIKRESLIDAKVEEEVYERALALLKEIKERAESGPLSSDEVRRLLQDVFSIQFP
jgi:hypothetical protein